LPPPLLRPAALVLGLLGVAVAQPPAPPRADTAPGDRAAFDESLARAEREHRAATAGPVERWRLAPVRSRYERLARQATDPAGLQRVRDRLAEVDRQVGFADSARALQTLLETSRRRDAEVAAVRRRVARLDRPDRFPFAATGRILASSRQAEGHRVYALIGVKGDPIAYLDVPPGLDAGPLLSRIVGVRGTVHYDGHLGNRLIAVRDLEALD